MRELWGSHVACRSATGHDDINHSMGGCDNGRWRRGGKDAAVASRNVGWVLPALLGHLLDLELHVVHPFVVEVLDRGLGIVHNLDRLVQSIENKTKTPHMENLVHKGNGQLMCMNHAKNTANL